jgi:FMN phosphatase YigB (HAD superfamily)
VGSRTPNSTIFACALNLLGVQASEVLMTDDNVEADIEPALALGMRAVHVNSLDAGRCIRHAYGEDRRLH